MNSADENKKLNFDESQRCLQLCEWTGRFSLGSLWCVGENLWKQSLPKFYDQKSDRVSHPGVCIDAPNKGIHATVSMLDGTHSRDYHKPLVSFRLDDSTGLTYFGHFGPIKMLWEDFQRKIKKSAKWASLERAKKKDWITMWTPKSCLNEKEKSQLKEFVRKMFSFSEVPNDESRTRRI